ncbi:MAG: hypothetical protein PHR77_01475 [Kiritimatiellae bacterium]|nr:hypothetical protein [Kiritimatiellia bacterium]MDD5521746.1 hypothetical protein [Kiritimatiellia bacterium]
MVESKEYPGKDTAMWDGLYAAQSGKVYTGLITERGSSHFYVYDPVKGENRCLYDIAEFLGERGKGMRTSGKIHNKPVEDSEGNIYFVPLNNGSGPLNIDFRSWLGGNWLKYDPKKDALENLGLVDDGAGCYPLAIDRKRNYLYGIGFTGYFYRFDIKNRVTRNFGRVDNWDICRNIVIDDEGNVYGSFPVARVWKYDAQKERIDFLSLRLPFDPTMYPTQLKNPMIDRSYIWRAIEWDPIDKVAYGITCGSGAILFKFDPHDGAEGRITELTRMCDSKFLDGNRKDVPYSTLAFSVDSKNKKVYCVPSARNYSFKAYAETFGSQESHHLIMYDIKAAKRVDLGAMQTADGRKVFGCEAASVGPDGTVYICGQVEVKNPKNSTSKVGDIPVALQLIIYKPQ